MIYNLIVLTKDNLAEYGRTHPEQFNPAWEQRDFVSQVSDFMHYRSGGIKMVSGLRGTGKTVGLMQTIKRNDALYIRCDEKGRVSINQVLDIIRSNPEKSNIIIDEFTWLKEFLPPTTDDDYAKRGDAERSIVALSESGKNIILTGTESASLEAIKARGFIHRTADTLHVTRFSFSEYIRIFKNSLPPRQQEKYDAFLREGGIFEDYVKQSIGGFDEYIRNSIVENLYAYIGSDKGLTREQIASGVYTVLFEAVHDIVNTSVPGEEFTEQAKARLAAMGVPDVTEKLRPEIVMRISETLENIGVIIKIPNAVPRKKRLKEAGLDDDERTYIVNPAISYRLARMVFGDIDREKDFLGHLMEAAVLVELDAIKRPGDKIYFFENDNKEVDAVIAPISGESPVSLIEVKHRYTISCDDLAKKSWSILSSKAEKQISERFPDNDIENRYFVYTGLQKILTSPKNGNTYLLVGIDECLRRYWDFDGNMDLIRKKTYREHKKNHHDNNFSKNNAKYIIDLINKLCNRFGKIENLRYSWTISSSEGQFLADSCDIIDNGDKKALVHFADELPSDGQFSCSYPMTNLIEIRNLVKIRLDNPNDSLQNFDDTLFAIYILGVKEAYKNLLDFEICNNDERAAITSFLSFFSKNSNDELVIIGKIEEMWNYSLSDATQRFINNFEIRSPTAELILDIAIESKTTEISTSIRFDSEELPPAHLMQFDNSDAVFVDFENIFDGHGIAKTEEIEEIVPMM